MRQLSHEQLSLTGPIVLHPHAEEMRTIDRILRDNDGMLQSVLQDLELGTLVGTGRAGMTAEQVLRVAVLKQNLQCTYRELSFHLADSVTYRAFCGFGLMDPAPSHTTLQRNVKSITEETWRTINRDILGYALELGVEDGREARIDGTVVAANIHAPSDSSLLWDGVRVLTRLTKRAHAEFAVVRFPDRTRRAKSRALDVLNAKGERARTKAYQDLLVVTKETVNYAQEAARKLDEQGDILAAMLAHSIRRYVGLTEGVIDQTERRVLRGEAVAAEDKLFSIFEDHADIIKKDNRDIHYGHKLTVSGGRSGLIMDWVVEDGNPADSNLTIPMLERHQDIYSSVPVKAVFDGCYASKDNLKKGKELGVDELAFSKKRGLEILDMTTSEKMYRKLRNFRAGIESWISFLKRCFGLDCCTWRGWEGFGRYVGASIVAANLLTLARRLE